MEAAALEGPGPGPAGPGQAEAVLKGHPRLAPATPLPLSGPEPLHMKEYERLRRAVEQITLEVDALPFPMFASGMPRFSLLKISQILCCVRGIISLILSCPLHYVASSPLPEPQQDRRRGHLRRVHGRGRDHGGRPLRPRGWR